MFPVFLPSTFPAPFVAKGSMATRSPASRRSEEGSPTLGMSFVQFRVPTSTVTAVSARYPSTRVPMSSLTRSPRRSTARSLCVGVKCAATSFRERQVGNAGRTPSACIRPSIRVQTSSRLAPSTRSARPYSRTWAAARPAWRTFSRVASSSGLSPLGNRPGPYYLRTPRGEVDNGGGEAKLAGPRVDEDVDGLPQLRPRGLHVHRGVPAVDVRARRGDRAEELREERGDGVPRDAEGDACLGDEV